MFDPVSPDEGTPPTQLTVQTPKQEGEILFPYPLAETEKSLTPCPPPSSIRPKVRLIFLINPDRQKAPGLPVWLHELVGWGVFLVLITLFLGLQIYLNRLLSGSLNQLVLIFTVLAEIGLLWGWDQFWY